MKLGQLIECNMKNIFLEKSCIECGGDPFQTLFWKIKIEHISGSIVLKFYTVYFYYMTSWGLSKYNETKLQTTCFYLILSFFFKKIRGLELVYLPHFPHNFF